MNPFLQSPQGSIWRGVERQTFERNIDALAATNAIPKPRDYTVAGAVVERDTDNAPLALDIERKLAGGFAFIASYNVGAAFVTAATIEASVEPPSLVVRLAANEGVQDCAFAAVAQILEDLRTCGKSPSSRQQCEERILETILRLNKNRIYFRIGSTLYTKPRRYIDPNRRPYLGPRFAEFVQRERRQTGRMPEDLDLLLREISAFHGLVDTLESSRNHDPVNEIKAITEQACVILKGHISVRSRLREIGVPETSLDDRVVREMDKLANYKRLSQELVKIRWMRGYRALFENPRLERTEPYRPIRYGREPKRFVHAEVQLLVHYETMGHATLPRVIGSSKDACYLCDAFITAHGRFHVSKAHRQVTGQWTVPERREYSNQSVRRMRQALHTINQHVRHDLATVRNGQFEGLRLEPPQSTTNLNSNHMPSPTISTLTALSGSRLSPKCLHGLPKSSSSSTVRSRNKQGDHAQMTSVISLESSSALRTGGSSVSTIKLGTSRLGAHETQTEVMDAVAVPEPVLTTSDARQKTPSEMSTSTREDKSDVGLSKDPRRDTLASGMAETVPLEELPSEKETKPKTEWKSRASVSVDNLIYELGKFALSPNTPRAYIETKKLEIHIELEDGFSENAEFQAASISLNRMRHSGLASKFTVEIGDLVAGQEVVFERTQENLKIGLRPDSGETIGLLCSWHGLIAEGNG